MGYGEESSCERPTAKKRFVIYERENLKAALRQMSANKGSPGG